MLKNSSLNIWIANKNICADWAVDDCCVLALKDEYVRRSCRVCTLANECWPGVHEGSVHTMQSGQSALREE